MTFSFSLKSGATAGVVAATLNGILFFIGSSLNWIPSTVIIPNANAPMTIFPVIFASIVPLLIGSLLAFGLHRLSNRYGIIIFQVIAILFLLLSFGSPLSIPDAPMSMIIVLNLMHTVAAVSLLYFLTIRTKSTV